MKDDQLQPSPVITLNRPLTPACGALSVFGESVRLEGDPFSITVKAWAGCEVIDIEPARPSTQPLGAALNDTVPLPVPVALPGTAIHSALLVAVQVQAVCTPNDPAPPTADSVAESGCRVMEQTAAPCVTARWCCFTRLRW